MPIIRVELEVSHESLLNAIEELGPMEVEPFVNRMSMSGPPADNVGNRTGDFAELRCGVWTREGSEHRCQAAQIDE